MKIHPVGVNLSMRMDGQTDRQVNMTKLIAEFRNFANTPKKVHANFHAFQRLPAVQDCKSPNTE